MVEQRGIGPLTSALRMEKGGFQPHLSVRPRLIKCRWPTTTLPNLTRTEDIDSLPPRTLDSKRQRTQFASATFHSISRCHRADLALTSLIFRSAQHPNVAFGENAPAGGGQLPAQFLNHFTLAAAQTPIGPMLGPFVNAILFAITHHRGATTI